MTGKGSSCLLVWSLLFCALPASPQANHTNRIMNPSWADADRPQPLPPLPARGPRSHGYPTIGFPNMVHASGIIFVGTVKRIERRPATNGQALETVAVTFHVEKALRGTRRGQNLTTSQWIGLWSSGQRYRVGQKVLLFLYPRSKLGLTSSVEGPLGRFTVDGSGYVLPTAAQFSAFRSDPVLGGKPRLRIGDFVLAVSQAGARNKP